MKRNVAGQKIGAQIVSATDGSAFTGAVTVYVTKDANTQAIGTVGSGAATHEGNGYYTYAPSQSETDGNLVAFTFIGSGAVPVTVQVTMSSEVWDVAYANHTTAGTFGKLQDTLRKANTVLEGTILASPTPTTTVFRLSGIDYPTGALTGSVLWLNSGASQEQNSPILSTLNNGDGTVTVTLENALVTAPTAGDTVLIDPTSHVHSVAEIQAGLGTIDNQRYLLSILAGATSSAGTAGETYTITISGSTYTVTFAGLDSVGNRGTTAFAKT